MNSEIIMVCLLCQKSEETDVTGPLSTKDQVTAHQNCLLYSSGLYCQESPEFDDLFGFSVTAVLEERKRGQKLSCSKCNKKGATVGCENRRCRKSYHYPCAIQANAHKMEDKEDGRFGLYCHRCKKTKLGLTDGDSSSSPVFSFNPKRKLDFSDDIGSKKHSKRLVLDDSDSDVTNVSEENNIFAPIESDDEATANSTPELLDGKRAPIAPRTDFDCKIVTQYEAENNSASLVASGANSEQSLVLRVMPTEITMDSTKFWKDCAAAGSTQALFSSFIREITDIFTRITSGQASNDDYDVAFNVMKASGKLQELIDKQQKDIQKKLKELQQAAAAIKSAALFLKR